MKHITCAMDAIQDSFALRFDHEIGGNESERENFHFLGNGPKRPETVALNGKM
jgi:hypothetical protein